ncbi:MAG: hypothetical protein H8D97_00345 [Proteobacteria bacterium]|nr:hypothetical protein [Pseudomonadota bacterium]
MNKLYKIGYNINNFLMNILYWVGHFNKLSEAKEYKRSIEVRSIENIKYYVNMFKWKEDRPWNWTPWIITLCARRLEDDCDGAAELGKWLLSKINIDSNLIVLKGSEGNHIICIDKNKTFMITNNQFVTINDSDNWKNEVLNWDWHKDKYSLLHIW